MRQPNRSFAALCLLLFLGSVMVPAREGIPGRRTGGGTRVSSPSELPSKMLSSHTLATPQSLEDV